MYRARTLLATFVAVVLALSGLALIGSPANARDAKKPVRPKVGQCRTTTYEQGFGYSDPRKPVACSAPHRMKTFAVVTIPKRINLKKINEAKLGRYAFDTCQPRFSKALGGSQALRAQTAYTWWSFIPTKAERKKGARWLRCDLSLLAIVPGGNSFAPPLPNLSLPMIGNRPVTDVTRRCLAEADNEYWTTCNRPHAARADQTFAINSATRPSEATVKAQAAVQCPGKRFTWPNLGEWRLGDRTATCYSVTTS